MTPAMLIGEIVQSLRTPQESLRRLLGYDLPAEAWWILLVLPQLALVLLQGILIQMGEPSGYEMPQQDGSKITITLPVFAFAGIGIIERIFVVFGTLFVGGMLGGKGTLGRVLPAIAVQNAQFFILYLGMFVVALIAPPLGAFGILGVWVYTCWTAMGLLQEAHEFESPIMSFVTYVGFYFALVVGLTMLLIIAGVFLGALGIGVPT